MDQHYYIEPDGDGEPTLWTATRAAHSSRAIARRCDTPPELWALARLLAEPFGASVVQAAMRDAIRVELDLRRAAGRGA